MVEVGVHLVLEGVAFWFTPSELVGLAQGEIMLREPFLFVGGKETGKLTFGFSLPQNQ